MFSNRYTIIYSTIMVIIVAVLLSLTATLLKPEQDFNIKIEKMQQILKSANIKAETTDAEKLYNENIIKEVLINQKSEIVSEFSNNKFQTGTIRAFDVDAKIELKKLYSKEKIKENILLPIFYLKSNNDTIIVLPLYGKGLWGPIWGYIALKNDKNTVFGITFDHKGETPGLGAEISQQKFQEQFLNKQILDKNDKFISIRVVKGGVKNSSVNPLNGVDAISGGTITSNGVDQMLKDCLSIYQGYLKK